MKNIERISKEIHNVLNSMPDESTLLKGYVREKRDTDSIQFRRCLNTVQTKLIPLYEKEHEFEVTTILYHILKGEM